MEKRDRGAVVRERTLGAAWLAIAAAFFVTGGTSSTTAFPIREIEQVSIEVDEPDPEDAIIARFADPERLGVDVRELHDPSPSQNSVEQRAMPVDSLIMRERVGIRWRGSSTGSRPIRRPVRQRLRHSNR